MLCSIFQSLFFIAQATHNRAGEITYTHITGFTYQIIIHTYTKASSVAADRDSLEILWGDGTSDTLPRTNGNGNGVLLGNNDIKYNEYTGTHTYPGLGTYVISIADPNRIAGIKNINGGNSVNEPFYIEDSLKILAPAFYGYDNSPILLNPPIDFGNVHFPYIHNPNAYDPDGDSLSFEFIVPRKAPNISVANYVDPNQVAGTQPPDTFRIDKYTGEVDWFDPYFVGTYNFAILIREYRSGVCIGTMVRDMEVIVDSADNRPPVVAAVHDTCVIAGTQLVLRVSASDPDPNQVVTITSNGGPYDVPADSATFEDSSGTEHASGIFTWNTTCDHVRLSFYQVIFKAEDSYMPPLVNLQNWLITVVAPPPQNVVATAVANDISVTWDNPYACATGLRFIGFSVWRREGSNPFAIDTCEVGLNGKGYTKIAEHLLDYSYLDQNVEIGKEYCYRVLAEFADKALSQYISIYYNNVYSLPSNEGCAQLAKVIPVITNVSVVSTSTSSGQMFVAWSKPSAADVDTIQRPGPYKYVIWRSQGFPGGTMQRIDSISASTFSALVDTIYQDNGLNTQDNPYSYKIGFYSNGNFLGETHAASSVYLNTTGSDNIVSLTWNEVVPWHNNLYVIYRKNGAVFDSIGTSTTRNYVDHGLVNLVQQCYQVKSLGSYSAPGFVNPIINYSEEQCAVPVDSVAPCPPVLEVHNLCNTPDFSLTGFVNELIWSFIDKSCADDVLMYFIYYSSSADIPMQVIDTVTDLSSNTFNHRQQDSSIAGCYAVAAVDSNLNVSIQSNQVCVDNCPVYVLPNVFTPNGDGHNDTYHPFLPINIFVSKVDMKIFDQWGDLVFQTTDPFIGWSGKDQKTSKDSPEAVYYYVCDVFSQKEKVGPTLSGYIHLFR